MNDQRKKTLGFVLLGVLILAQLVGLYFGINFPVVELSEPDFGPIEEQIVELEGRVDLLQGEVDPAGMDFSVGGGARPTNFAYVVAGALAVKNDAEVWDTFYADTIAEYTSGSGVTIDGLTIKDGGLGESLSISGAITPTRLFIDGGNDAIQLTVQGYTTQTSDLLVLEDYTGTNVLEVDGSGNIKSGTGAITMTDDVAITGTLTLESVAFSGPITFGSAASVVTGTEIAHGLGVTPTAIVLTPVYDGVFTNTVYVLSSNTTSITIGIGYTTGVTTVSSVNWMAGK